VTITIPTEVLIAVFVAAAGAVIGVVTACLPEHLKVLVWQKITI